MHPCYNCKPPQHHVHFSCHMCDIREVQVYLGQGHKKFSEKILTALMIIKTQKCWPKRGWGEILLSQLHQSGLDHLESRTPDNKVIFKDFPSHTFVVVGPSLGPPQRSYGVGPTPFTLPCKSTDNNPRNLSFDT